MLQCIGLYPAAFDFAQGIFLEWSSDSFPRKAIAGASSSFDIFSSSPMKAETVHRGAAVLLGRADASARPKEASTQLKDPPTFSIDSLSVLFCLI